MSKFSDLSKKRLSMARPELQVVANAAILQTDFMVLDSLRGRLAQEKAFRTKMSKARFGESAHNYFPAIAYDLFPAPYDWDNTKAFVDLSEVILSIAKEKGIPLRWGGDWNMDGNNPGDTDNWDKPHYELHPWRTWAKKSKLFEG